MQWSHIEYTNEALTMSAGNRESREKQSSIKLGALETLHIEAKRMLLFVIVHEDLTVTAIFFMWWSVVKNKYATYIATYSNVININQRFAICVFEVK